MSAEKVTLCTVSERESVNYYNANEKKNVVYNGYVSVWWRNTEKT